MPFLNFYHIVDITKLTKLSSFLVISVKIREEPRTQLSEFRESEVYGKDKKGTRKRSKKMIGATEAVTAAHADLFE